jgi:hypothetical protein
MAGREPLKVAVVHWMPLEMYPPAMNLVRELAQKGWSVTVHTTHNRHGLDDFFAEGVSIHRAPSASSMSAMTKAKALASFHVGTARRLVSDSPDAVIYFEPQSSFPVYLASSIRKDIPLFIHHHEYHEPAEFERRGMRLARLFHGLEQKSLFGRARWISHTNEARRELFLADNGESLRARTRIVRNMPPAPWSSEPNRAWHGGNAKPLRMVYVGSLSRSDTYIEACIEWVQSQDEGLVTLDVYAYNTDAETAAYLESVAGGRIRFHSRGVSYDELPQLLRDFHTGLILYKARTLNYRHNASNKLFEYLACGLDVLYPPSMLGVKPYERMSESPRVIEVDFTNGWPALSVLASRDSIPEALPHPTASDELSELCDELARAVRRQ